MTSSVILFASLAGILGADHRPPFIRLGADLAQGVLVNLAPGSRPFDPAVAARPTVVFVHGFNPLPRVVHFTMAEQLAGALARRAGPSFNVYGWDWNGATCVGLDGRANAEAAVAQGRALSAALCRVGVVPAGLHLIGHSSGCIVAASAARTIAVESGRVVAQLTLLEPAGSFHPLIFERLAAGAAARRVENYWSPGPSAYGREAAALGVENVRIDSPHPYAGVVNPRLSSHLFVMQWYLGTIDNPGIPSGFNRSLLFAAGA
jgi:pimeloyl-ACP methyl ester carboxylesterase